MTRTFNSLIFILYTLTVSDSAENSFFNLERWARISRTQQTLISNPSRRGRTFTGCYNCGARKVKCNEAVPECGPCQKRGITCSGYESKLVWVTSHQKSYKPNGRRFLQCEFTWAPGAVLDPEELDYFVSLCDAAPFVKGFTVEWSPESKVPFGAFASQSCAPPFTPPPSTLSRSLIYGAPLKDDEALLFQHYVNHVVYIMMPYEDLRNPWQSSYPAVALYHFSKHQSSLCKALLAQAAFNLANLHCQPDRMLKLGTEYYTSAMEEFRHNLLAEQKDYGTFVACIMTLMFVEIYSGNSGSWRAHFQGAWSFLENQKHLQPWTVSAFAESSTQSLCLIKIVHDTSSLDEHSATFDNAAMSGQETLVSSISSYSSFGFTIGATGLLMICIADIRRLGYKFKSGICSEVMDDTAQVLVRLDQCREVSSKNALSESNSKSSMISIYHFNAFIAATYIYLYQSVFESPPNHVRQYVAEVFHNIQAFFALGDGNLSLWPAFIAATAAYDPVEVEAAKEWLKRASQVGIGSRMKVQAVIEEVWRLRDVTSVKMGQDLGNIVVDWREVMQKMGLDILLV